MTAPLRTRRLSGVDPGGETVERITSNSALPLFAGMLHAEVGEGESGKTWVAAHAGLDVARTGRQVLVLDGEMSAASWRRRIDALGATDDELSRISYVEMDANAVEPEALAATCASIAREGSRVGLLLWDSALSMLSRCARSENDNAEVSRVYDKLRDAVRRTDAAGLIVDHSARGSSTLVSRGATAKFNALDVSYGVRLAEGSVPSPLEPWSSVISVEKDRHGLLGTRADREAAFSPAAGLLNLTVTECHGFSHRLSPNNPVTATLAKVSALDPPPRSGNDAFNRIGGTRSVVLGAYKAWKEAQS